jgi:O-antigen/teichoic acid export membrane protein
MLGILAGPSGAIITMAGRSRETLIFMVAGAALMLALALVLVPPFGITGLAMAYVAGYGVRIVQGWWLARRILLEKP